VPGNGQESVWDYPRPPRLVDDAREVIVRAGDVEIARTSRSVRVLETASPPTFYLPWNNVLRELFEPSSGSTWCEWKGRALYWTIVVDGRRFERAAWSYPHPSPGFADLADRVSFYPSRVECDVGGIRVQPQPGHFYGGWVTPEIVGPFKGAPGTEWW
jgi:uncharacterized protein (DUF427 family)